MESLQDKLVNAKKAQNSICTLSDAHKRQLIEDLATVISVNSIHIIEENHKDLQLMDDTNPKKDRLLLDASRIEALCESLRTVAGLKDPTQVLLMEKTLDNGLSVQKITVPLGVVAAIYESRPNVTLDVAALCLRSGNVCLLRGGQDAFHTNVILVRLIQDVLETSGLDRNIVQQLPADRAYMLDVLTADRYIDVIIPRGSAELIQFVRQHATVPVIETGAGVCHTYVEAMADLEVAVSIIVNAKVSRPSVCNALDTVLVDSVLAKSLLNKLSPILAGYKVEIFADEASYDILLASDYKHLRRAAEEDYGREFLDYKCSVKVVSGLSEALDHISLYSSRHSEAIVTEDIANSEIFLNQVDAAVVYLNASTRFTDGEVFGLGAEIGISTQKLHARGPFALEKLVTEKWVVRGKGQIR